MATFEKTLESDPRSTILGFDRRCAIAVIAVLGVLGGLTGTLVGSVAGIAAFIAAGLLWGAGLLWVAGRMARTESRRNGWANRALYAGVTCAGLASGAAIMGQLIMTAATPDAPQFFASLVRGSIGVAEALPFYVFNGTMEWLVMPLVLLLNWQNRRRRRLIIVAFVIWYLHRAGTYLYFVHQITEWAEGTAPLTPGQIDEATLWVRLSWIRNAMDIAIAQLLLAAAFIPIRRSSSAEPVTAPDR